MWWSKDTWFHADFWDFLGMREAGNVGDLLRPHVGHWQAPAVLQIRLLHAIVGMDYWPAYFLPRLAWLGGYSLFARWVMGRRGADPVLALGAVAVLSALGTSG